MLDSILTFLKNALETILSNLCGYIKGAFDWVVQWLYGLAMAFILPVLASIGNMMPSGWKSAILSAIYLGEQINSWVPIIFGLKMFIAYYSIKGTMTVVKWTLKAIPTIWG